MLIWWTLIYMYFVSFRHVCMCVFWPLVYLVVSFSHMCVCLLNTIYFVLLKDTCVLFVFWTLVFFVLFNHIYVLFFIWTLLDVVSFKNVFDLWTHVCFVSLKHMCVLCLLNTSTLFHLECLYFMSSEHMCICLPSKHMSTLCHLSTCVFCLSCVHNTYLILIDLISHLSQVGLNIY